MNENTGLINDLEREGFVVTDFETDRSGTRYYVYQESGRPFTEADLDVLYDIASMWESIEFVRTQSGIRHTAMISVFA